MPQRPLEDTLRPEFLRGTDDAEFDANDVPIDDAGGYYTATEVEGALQELGAAGASPLTVEEDDGNPSASPVTTIVFDNGTVTDEGGGVVRVTNGGGGSGGGGSHPASLFGTGDDGDVVINSGAFTFTRNGTNVINNNVLTRDAWFNDLTLNGGNLRTAGFRLYVKGTLSLVSGNIHNNGAAPPGPGGDGTDSAGGAAGTVSSPPTGGGNTSAPLGGLAGRVGGFNANGVAGFAGSSSNTGLSAQAGAAGGASGQGQTGGAGGTDPIGANNNLSERPFDLNHALMFRPHNSVTAFTIASLVGRSSGSGSGAGSPASGGGGSGGTGTTGGPVIVVAQTVTGTEDIQSRGGAGAAGGAGGGTDAGGGAGGAGGHGAIAVLVTNDRSGWSGVLDVAGGAGGAGGAGIGTGSAGGNGPAGISGWAIYFDG